MPKDMEDTQTQTQKDTGCRLGQRGKEYSQIQRDMGCR